MSVLQFQRWICFPKPKTYTYFVIDVNDTRVPCCVGLSNCGRVFGRALHSIHTHARKSTNLSIMVMLEKLHFSPIHVSFYFIFISNCIIRFSICETAARLSVCLSLCTMSACVHLVNWRWATKQVVVMMVCEKDICSVK